MITQEFIKSVLNYDEITGELTWANPPKFSRFKAGAKAGTPNPLGYIYVRLNGKRRLAHRIIWLYVYGYFPDKHIDHINGNPSDNSIKNLREATVAENQQNRIVASRFNSSGLIGVTKVSKTGIYIAMIQKDKKKYYLGRFKTAVEAHNAYLSAKKQLHKSFVERA
jgi:hypothetical protein